MVMKEGLKRREKKKETLFSLIPILHSISLGVNAQYVNTAVVWVCSTGPEDP
jgi:hypothetical protein